MDMFQLEWIFEGTGGISFFWPPLYFQWWEIFVEVPNSQPKKNVCLCVCDVDVAVAAG